MTKKKKKWLTLKAYYPKGTYQVFQVVFLFKFIPIWWGWSRQIHE